MVMMAGDMEEWVSDDHSAGLTGLIVARLESVPDINEDESLSTFSILDYLTSLLSHILIASFNAYYFRFHASSPPPSPTAPIKTSHPHSHMRIQTSPSCLLYFPHVFHPTAILGRA